MHKQLLLKLEELNQHLIENGQLSEKDSTKLQILKRDIDLKMLGQDASTSDLDDSVALAVEYFKEEYPRISVTLQSILDSLKGSI